MSTVAETAEPLWRRIIVPKRGWLDIRWRDLWLYRDLIWLMALRDISASYKQTVLGPAWFVLQPVLTTAVFSFLFGRMADLGTDHTPHFVFYMSGLVVWNYFADCLNKTSLTFVRNAQLFGKVYFPRMVVPLANMLGSLAGFLIQFALLTLAIIYYLSSDQGAAHGRIVPGPVQTGRAMVVVEKGILKVGDPFNCGGRPGRVIRILNESGVSIQSAGPGVACKVVGFTTSPKMGDPLLVPPSHIAPNWRIVVLPFLLGQVAMLAMGMGFLISSLTTRYKDLAMGVGFGVQLWMYGSSIIFPLSRIQFSRRWIFECNPMVPIVESFRLALLGHGIVDKTHLVASFCVCATVLFVGVVMFNRAEQTVMDTV